MKKQGRIGFAFCGSYCTYAKAVEAMRLVAEQWERVIPIVADSGAVTDTRFGEAAVWLARMEEICGQSPLTSIPEVEPIGPKKLLDALVICPCTGNTLAKLAHGITDTSVTMAAKSHLRNGRPVVLALSTNDGLAAAAENIGRLLARRDIYFVPFGQDDPRGKPRSLAADHSQIPEALQAAMEGRQLQPLLLGAGGQGAMH